MSPDILIWSPAIEEWLPFDNEPLSPFILSHRKSVGGRPFAVCTHPDHPGAWFGYYEG